MNYKKILATKNHNPHYLNRYIKFIDYCKKKNLNIEKSIYVEKHHICPQANDMFPEYASFKNFPNNQILLTDRQHFISHYLLWKSYSWSSMTYSFKCFVDDYTTKHHKRTYRKITSRIYAKLKQETIEYSKGKMAAKDITTGLYSRVSVDEYRSNSNLITTLHAKVSVKNIITGETSQIDADDYGNDVNLVSIAKDTVVAKRVGDDVYARVSIEDYRQDKTLTMAMCGKIIVTNNSTLENISITKEEYYSNKSKYTHSSSGNVVVIDIESCETKMISSEEYYSNKNKFKTKMCGKVSVKDLITNITKSVSMEEYRSNENLVCNSTGMVVAKNIETGKTCKVTKEEFDSNPLLVAPSYGMVNAFHIIRKVRVRVSKKIYNNDENLIASNSNISKKHKKDYGVVHESY